MKIDFTSLFLGSCLIIEYANARLINSHETIYGRRFMKKGSHRAKGKDRQFSISENKNLTLQSLWWNWNVCTSAFLKDEFTPMNSLVPKDVVFLAGFQNFGPKVDGVPSCADPLTRTGTISAGVQTFFFPIYNSQTALDLNDDFVLGKPDCFGSMEEATFARFYVAFEQHMQMVDPELYNLLYAQLDGEPLTIFYLIEVKVRTFKQCPDERTNQEYEALQGNPHGELCDAEPFSQFEGVDYGPMHGWWGMVTREFVSGDVHTFEFGGVPASLNCISAKYVLTVE